MVTKVVSGLLMLTRNQANKNKEVDSVIIMGTTDSFEDVTLSRQQINLYNFENESINNNSCRVVAKCHRSDLHTQEQGIREAQTDIPRWLL